ncbi:hypothetical protein D3C76_1568860 [compost metagenome]
MAADAVVALPDALAAYHRFRQLRLVAAFWKGLFRVVGQGQEYQEKEDASPEINIPGHAFGEGI